MQQLVNAKQTYLIDVRESDEFSEGAIPTSKNISVQDLQRSFRLADKDFEDQYGFKKPSKNDKIVFYCRSGKRSAIASTIAESLGYTDISDYSGSWLDWQNPE